MIKFSKLALDDIASIRKKSLGLIGCLLAAAGIACGIEAIKNSSIGLTETCKDLSNKQLEISALEGNTTDLHSTLQSMAYEESVIKSKEDIVIALGECAQKSGCTIVGLSSKTSQADRSIIRYNFTFEVKSDLVHISRLLSQIDTKGLHYAINELSLRQEADYLWLQRDFQDDINWWDVSNISTGNTSQTKPQLTSGEIMADNNMKFYFDLDFIVISEVL